MSWVGVAVGVASLAMGATEASGALSPSQPNFTADSQAMANTQAELLPELQQLQKTAELGGSTLLPGYTQTTQGDQQRQQIQDQINSIQQGITGPHGEVFDSPNSARTQAQIAQLQQQLANIPQGGGPVYKDKNGNIVPASQAVANFSGNSYADIQKQLMTQADQGQLANAAQYDPQFIAQALQEEQLANPQGVTAASELNQQIQNQINNPISSPVANELDRQETEKVNAGNNLTPEEMAMLNQDMSGSAGITGTGNKSPDLSQAMTTGFAGQQRQLGNEMSGASWLASGQTPADIQYREQQQNLANLTDLISGKTPESQFSSLSGANNGPTPNAGTTAQPGYNMNAASQGANAGLQQYNNELSQPSPWTAGLSGVLGAASVGANVANSF